MDCGPCVFFYIIVIIIAIAQAAPDNAGTEFILGFTEQIRANNDVELIVTTLRTTIVNVNVSAPRFEAAKINESKFSLTAGEAKRVYISALIRSELTSMSTKGILIAADDEVSIIGVNGETMSYDSFLGLPTDVLGKTYYTMTFSPATEQCEVLIVGVYDSTYVSITFGENLGAETVEYEGRTYSSLETLTLSLDRFSTFQFHSTGDLSGTYIYAEKHIAVFSGNKKTRIGSHGTKDHLIEQLYPVDTWGKVFITVPVPDRTEGDFFRVIASEDDTRLVVTGGYETSIEFKTTGRVEQLDIPSDAYCQWEADKPILLVQFSKSQPNDSEPSDPMMMLIPPVKQYGNAYTFGTPHHLSSSFVHYFIVIVTEVDLNGLRMNGDSLPFSLECKPVLGSLYLGCFCVLPDGTYTVRHTSPIATFGGFLYGQRKKVSYGTAIGLRQSPINTVCVPTDNVIGDGLDNDCDGAIDEDICGMVGIASFSAVGNEDCAKPSPVDGGWSNWGEFGLCSLNCTDHETLWNGTKTRTRTCTNPEPAYDGRQCSGTDTNEEPCSPDVYCPIHGAYGTWSAWGTCSVTCGTGRKIRTRACDSPAPKYGGDNCTESAEENAVCNTNLCPETYMIGFMAAEENVNQFRIHIVNVNRETADITIDSIFGTIVNFSLSAGQERDVPIPLLFMMKGTNVDNLGIRISSSQPVLVYGGSNLGGISEESMDGFVALPVSHVGTKYLAVTDDGSSVFSYSQLLIVGIHFNTSVNIKVRSSIPISYGGDTFSSGQVISIQLNIYDTFQILVMQGDLTGTEITTNLPVSVFCGNTILAQQAHVVEQLPPVRSWGLQFVAMSLSAVSHKCKIVSAFPGTTVEQICTSGFEDSHNLDAGESKVLTTDNRDCTLISNHPVMVGMILASSSHKFAMTILQPVTNISNALAFYVPEYVNSTSIVLSTLSNNIDQLTINCASINATDVISLSVLADMVIAYKEVDSGLHVIQSTKLPFLMTGYTYGITSTTSLALPLIVNATYDGGHDCNRSATKSMYTDDITTVPSLNQSCYCRKYCPTNYSYTTEELEELIQELRNELLINKKLTSMFLRARISAKDDRPTARALGFTGCLVLILSGVSLVIMDLDNLLLLFKTIKGNIFSFVSGNEILEL